MEYPRLRWQYGLVLVVLACCLATDAFEYSGYCRKMCMVGRGGNLCKCSAVHFAGKRSNALDSDPIILDLEIPAENDVTNWRSSLGKKLDILRQGDPAFLEAMRYYLTLRRGGDESEDYRR
ncbi:hypothetical protein CAPTEDRAFT_227908 [Capitella teleta]|uniref:Invertebrate defensins family profile domain-containing protein n=1 Tax=Capitella teleta TaxID=283909 RepID=R7UED0_CAPTE|nr:hypothetical protein CAPTEDRAFT_227908 [Capitella teleta]|eukprot:ELU01627.1 hypothetical protein CAPTEDRAFT_227908 [Capitella teleta]